jgi:hypothetical protein
LVEHTDATIAPPIAARVVRDLSLRFIRASERQPLVRMAQARADEPIDRPGESALFAVRSCMLGELVKTNEPWREVAADHHGTICGDRFTHHRFARFGWQSLPG